MMTSTPSPTRIALASVCCLASACGGPDYHFDPAPAPSWTQQATSNLEGAQIRMIGQAPITAQVQRDLDLATRDGKNRIAQTVTSQIVGRTSDWSLVISGSENNTERQVTTQNIEVRTNVQVEGANVESSYRDEQTHSQYVLVSVNRAAWADTLHRRLAEGFANIEAKAKAATDAAAANHPLGAYGSLTEAFQIGQQVEPDIIVIDLLDPSLGIRHELGEIKTRLDDINRTVHATPFALQIRCADGDIKSDVGAKVGTFLKQSGFAAGKGKGIRVEIEVAQKHVATEKVASRTEFVHAAQGTLRVLEPDASEVGALSIALTGDAYTERDTQEKAAKTKALRLAADTLLAKLRSKFRTAFPQVGE